MIPMNDTSNVVEVPGESMVIGFTGLSANISSRPPTSASTVPSFDAIKHLLSSKPLRRPNRTRPID